VKASPHRELVHVGLADDDCTLSPQSTHHCGIAGRPEVPEHAGRTRGGQILREERVFDSHRNALQPPHLCAARTEKLNGKEVEGGREGTARGGGRAR